MVTAAKLKKPAKLIALDLFDERLQRAKDFGADIVINASRTDVAKEILEMTDGYGCDVYIEATGDPSSVVQGLEAICKNGRFIEFSLFNDPVTCNWSVIGDGKELDMYGVSLSPDCYPPVIEGIASGKIKTDGIVTHFFKLKDFAAAFEMCMDRQNSIKVVLQP
jgi:threonine dehydrogenase-like Zn-dependent dehydrogenase